MPAWGYAGDMFTLPNLLSAFRIAAAPVLMALACLGLSRAFLALFALTLISDAVDGFVARLRHQETELGARLDSLGDLATVLVLPVSSVLLWPDIVVREIGYIATALVCYFLPTLVGTLRYGRPPSYHTWGAKVSAVVMGFALLALFLGISPWPFRLSMPLVVLEAVEEVVMTAMLREWHANVPSSWHAYRLRQSERAKGRA